MTDLDKEIDGLTELLENDPELATNLDGIVMDEYTFTNDKTNKAIRHLFHMFYQSVFKNKLGVMHARNKVDGKVHTILVGVELTPDGTLTWPIAKVLTEAEQGQYEAPDGNGNYGA